MFLYNLDGHDVRLQDCMIIKIARLEICKIKKLFGRDK